MEQQNYIPPQEKNTHIPLKIFEIAVFIAVVAAAIYYFAFYQKNALQKSQEEFQQQKEEAIAKRDASMCPGVTSPFDGSVAADKECIAAVKQLTVLDSLNALVVRAIKEKNEKLCNAAEKSFREVCAKAVRDAISGNAKPLENPILGR